MIEIKTLSLVIGLGNLIFAIMIAIYGLGNSADSDNTRALRFWKWGKLTSGLGFLLVWLRGTDLTALPSSLANDLQIVGLGMEFVAYCCLLKLNNWQRPAWLITAISLVLYQTVAIFSTSRHFPLLVLSLVCSFFYGAMAYAVLRKRLKGAYLLQIIGLTDVLASFLLALRLAKGIFFEELIPFAGNMVNIALYILAYVSMLINGFGFLLLTKQQDDKKLLQALVNLRSAESSQRQLLSMASHEFRTPAAMIKAALDSLKFLRDQIPPDVSRRLENIQQASQRLNQLANNLISHDRLQALGLSPDKSTINLERLIATVTSQYPDDGQLLFVPPDKPVLVHADPTLLGIAIHNLIDNACRYHAHPHEPIRLALRVNGNRVELQVCDRGPGIADAEKDKVFQRFYSSQIGCSHGLGLAIVDSVARAHGGSAVAADNPGGGAMLLVYLPLA